MHGIQTVNAVQEIQTQHVVRQVTIQAALESIVITNVITAKIHQQRLVNAGRAAVPL